MALNAEQMKNEIISAMLATDPETAEDANKIFGDVIIANLVANTSIVYGWVAVDPEGNPDPAVAFNATVSGGGVLTPSGTFDLMLVKLSNLIKGLTITPDSGFDVGPLTFNPAAQLLFSMELETTQADAMLHFCEKLVDQIILFFPDPASKGGSHAVFNGATTQMQIS